jgi:hypothetical protein
MSKEKQQKTIAQILKIEPEHETNISHYDKNQRPKMNFPPSVIFDNLVKKNQLVSVWVINADANEFVFLSRVRLNEYKK